jgi:hypothetical protein
VVVGVPGYVVKSRLPDEGGPEEPANGEYTPRLAGAHTE